jgi:RNA polymerase sigma factor (sigma-70 family)
LAHAIAAQTHRDTKAMARAKSPQHYTNGLNKSKSYKSPTFKNFDPNFCDILTFSTNNMKTNKMVNLEKDKFISVIKENQNLIFKICYSYCASPANRKDLQQEILIQLWRSFPKFDGRVKISTWIYKVALNTAIFYYRNDFKHASKRVPLDDSVIVLSNSESELDENILMLYNFIERLHDLDKALILLYLDDHKQKDIAEILGLSETNVATKISRIKKTLKEQFNTIKN